MLEEAIFRDSEMLTPSSPSIANDDNSNKSSSSNNININNNNEAKSLSNLLQSVPAMIYTYSVNHDTGGNNFHFVSDYCEEMFGLTSSKIVNESESFVNLVHPDDANGFAASVLHSMKTMTVWDHKMRMMNADSELIYVHGKSTPHREDVINETGTFTKVTVWHGVLYDITSRYEEECQLKKDNKNKREKEETVTTQTENENENKTETETETSIEMEIETLKIQPAVPLFSIGSDGIIQDWNSLMTELTDGLHETDVVGKPLQSLVTDTNKDLVQQLLSTSQAKYFSPSGDDNNHIDTNVNIDVDIEVEIEVDEYSHDLIISSKKGNDIHLCITFDTKQRTNPNKLYCECEDVTSIKVAEEETKVAYKLLDAEKKLSEWLSHEIRNPLSIAMEAAKTLKEIQSNLPRPTLKADESFSISCTTSNTSIGGDSLSTSCDGEALSYVDLIIQSISYVVDLLSNILDLNKLAAGKIVLRPSTCCLKAEIIQPIRRMMNVKDNKVPITFIGKDMLIHIDRLRLQQVITNLLSNALKFTTKGIITIDSQRTTKDVDGSTIQESLIITVSDTGRGLPEKNRKLLFSKWEQLGSSVNGTGIGLCLSRFLVTAMKGELYLNETYDSGIKGSPGAQFVVRIPFDEIMVNADEGSSSPRHQNTSNMHNNENVSISAYSALSHAVIKSTTKKSSKKPPGQTIGTSSSSITKENNNSYINGVYRLLIVDDDTIVRKMLRRRISRIFPESIIDEADCGEKAIGYACGSWSSSTSTTVSAMTITSVASESATASMQEGGEQKDSSATNIIYDVIFIDHFMGDGLTGDQTIKVLRENNVDSLIVGVSGNSMENCHISAGAEEFFQKPLPSQHVVMDRLLRKLSPPAGWNVLIVDDVKLNCHFLERRLLKIASAHFTTMKESRKRWYITKITDANEAINKLKTEWFDLIILDQELNNDDGIKGSDIAAFARVHGLNKRGIIVQNSASSPDKEKPSHFNISWSKPLPSEAEMRQSICEQLLRQQHQGVDNNPHKKRKKS